MSANLLFRGASFVSVLLLAIGSSHLLAGHGGGGGGGGHSSGGSGGGGHSSGGSFSAGPSRGFSPHYPGMSSHGGSPHGSFDAGTRNLPHSPRDPSRSPPGSDFTRGHEPNRHGHQPPPPSDHGHHPGHWDPHHHGWSPWFAYNSWDWDWGWGWDRYYSYYQHYPTVFSLYWPSYFAGYPTPYACNYLYQYDGDAGSPYDVTPSEAAPESSAPAPEATAQLPTSAATAQQGDETEAMGFFADAARAFKEGNYRNALRLTSHAAVESPQNHRVHELMSLSLFALKDYRGAATAAHAALAMGPLGDWNGLFAYYGDAEKYTTQLRVLEKYAGDNPSSAPARFLLGYHYLLVGSRSEAKSQFAQAVKLTPSDKLAAHLLRQLEANLPITPPTDAAKQPGELL